MVVARLSGQTLAHGIEGFGAGTSLVGQLQLLFNLPANLARTIDPWVDMQIRLHRLPAEPLLRAVTTVGIDAGAITFEGQLARLRTIVERSALTGSEPRLCLVRWSSTSAAAEGGDLPWRLSPAQYSCRQEPAHRGHRLDQCGHCRARHDVGSAIANISAIPRSLRWGLHAAAQAKISAALRRYGRAYRARCPLDDQAVLYHEVFRAVAQLVWVGQPRAAGRAGGDAFHSAAGVGNLIALIRKLSGVSLRFE